MNIEVTLLSNKDIKENEIIKKIGPACNYNYWTSAKTRLLDYGAGYAVRVTTAGNLNAWADFNWYQGVRPVIKTDNLYELIKNSQIKIENDIETIEYGTYPNLEERINIFNEGSLFQTGKKFVLPKKTASYPNYEYKLIYCDEYVYKNQRVIKFGELYYKVKPVEFYIDRKNNMLISKDVLFLSPINLDNPNYDGNFETSQLYQFLNNEFIKNLKSEMENDETLEIQKTKGKPYIKTLFHNH